MNKEVNHTILEQGRALGPERAGEAEAPPAEQQPASPDRDIIDLGAYLRQRTVEAQIGLLLQKTPRKEIRTRLLNPKRPEGPDNPRLKYLEHAYVTETLNLLFGFNWDLEVLEQQRIENEAVVKTRLRVRLADGSTIVKDGFGGANYQPNNPNSSWADTFKAAESDGLKAAAARLGIGLDLYRHEEQKQMIGPGAGEERRIEGDSRSPEVAPGDSPGRATRLPKADSPMAGRGEGWNWFWGAKVRELGLSREEVHRRLGVTSVKDWVAQGHTLEEAVKVLEGRGI